MSGVITPAPSDTYATSAFSDDEKAQVRRFCGYEAYGQGAAGFQGWRFFQAYGLLEYRLNNLAPAEFSIVRQYLTNLYTLETALMTMSNTLNVDQAAAFKRNANERKERHAELRYWRERMCSFLGVPKGPGIADEGGSVRIVV
ncbi:MAG TPA: hypothetical protein VMH92_05690 [Acidocella sp.]|nr:hypothetical protein [Acidocella sp.]